MLNIETGIDYTKNFVRLDIDGQEAVLSNIGYGITSTVYRIDKDGARHADHDSDTGELLGREFAAGRQVPLIRVNHSLIEQVIDEKDARADFPAFYADRHMLKSLGL
jgi:hypothetical protein